MWKKNLLSSIISIISTLACAAAIIAIALFGEKIIQDLNKNTEKQQQNIEAEYEELHEDNFDEETGKKILRIPFLLCRRKSEKQDNECNFCARHPGGDRSLSGREHFSAVV